MPVWTVREAAACGLTEAERAAIVGRSRRFGLSGRAGISSKCEIKEFFEVSRGILAQQGRGLARTPAKEFPADKQKKNRGRA